MVCKPIFTEKSKGARGFTLVEVLITLSISVALLGVASSFAVFNGRNLAILSNCLDVDQANRVALDQMTRDIRQVNRLTAFTNNAVAFEDSDGAVLTYAYDSAQGILTRTKGAVATILLRGCTSFDFEMFQRNIIEGSYDFHPALSLAECKVIGVAWSCSRAVLGQTNVSGGQTARIVIRKK